MKQIITETHLMDFEEKFAQSLDDLSEAESADSAIRAFYAMLATAKKLARENAELRQQAA